MNQQIENLASTDSTTYAPKIVTIGVYGFDETTFFQALQEAGVDTLCDIRRRRGVRGSRYAFANSKRLQKRLAELGIQYLHLLELAPTAEVRNHQKTADKTAAIAKRKRTGLDQSFIDAYKEEILTQFDARSFLEELDEQTDVIALFCVEREPDACHRSLVAGKLADECGLEVRHLVPRE
jgi:uncharacterized protein (DUF488 family)